MSGTYSEANFGTSKDDAKQHETQQQYMNNKSVTSDHTDFEYIPYASHSSVGFRPTQEDRISIYSQVLQDKLDEQISFAFFGVFDGHCGEKCAHFCSQNLCSQLLCNLAEENVTNQDYTDNISTMNTSVTCNDTISRKKVATSARKILKNIRQDQVIINTFLKTDEIFKNIVDKDAQNAMKNLSLLRDNSGSTAITATIITTKKFSNSSIRHEIIISNLGDSRCIMYDRGKTIPLSEDHKPYTQTESERIVNAGGFVVNGRLFGQISVSRSFGDFHYKDCPGTNDISKQAMIAIPEIKRITIESQGTAMNITTVTSSQSPSSSSSSSSLPLSSSSSSSPSLLPSLLPSLSIVSSPSSSSSSSENVSNESIDTFQFLVLACDGIFDVMSNEEVTEFIVEKLVELKKKHEKQLELSPSQQLNASHFISRQELEDICKQLTQHCISHLDSADNTTLIIILLNHQPSSSS